MKYLILSLLTAFVLFGCSFQQQVPEISSMDELEYPFSTQRVQLSDGMEIAYTDQGQGSKTLLMVHGLGSYAPAWKKNIENLSSEYRCIAIDLPGYGKSSKGKYSGSMRFYADALKAFKDALRLENVVLMGHSMGGQISMVASLAYPTDFPELVLIAPAGFETFHAGQKKWFREVLTPNAVALTPVDQIKANIGANFYKMPRDAEFMIYDRVAMRQCKDFSGYCYIIPQCVQGMVDEPVFEFLPDLNARTLVIFGAQDNLIPNRFLNGGTTRSVAEAGMDQLPNAELKMVSQAGHFVHFEQSDSVNARIRTFLGSEDQP